MDKFTFGLKSDLYRALKAFPNDTETVLGGNHYPNIKDKNTFLDGVINIVEKYKLQSKTLLERKRIEFLEENLRNAKNRKNLSFIQNEKADEWVPAFSGFYKTEIASHPNKKLVMDTEKQVEQAIIKDPIEIGGKVLANYSFVESQTCSMIQVCDYVVSILRKYFVFVDRTQAEIKTDIKSFDDDQMENFKLLNKVLRRSLEHNPLCFHYITCLEMQHNLNELMMAFG